MSNTKRYFQFLKATILPIFLFFLPHLLIGQELQFSFHNISDQLTDPSHNYYIFHDSKGMIWISSTEGVNRFDGKNVTPFLPKENIQSDFFEDKKNNIWFGVHGGIYCFERKDATFQFYQINGIDEESYQLYYLDTLTNSIWLRVGRDFLQYDLQSKKTIKNFGDRNLNIRSLMKTLPGKDQYLLINPMSKGVEVSWVDCSSKELIFSDTILEDLSISSFYFEDENTLWLGSENKLFKYDLNKHDIIQRQIFQKNIIPRINGIVATLQNELVISTPSNGIYLVNKDSLLLEGNIYDFDGKKLIPFSYTIDRIFLDRKDNLWISTNGDGVFFTNLQKRKINRYLSNDHLPENSNNNVKYFAEDSKGNVFCLTKNKIIRINFQNGEILNIDPPQLHVGNEPFSIFIDKKDYLWYCSSHGLFVKKKTEGEFEEIQIPGKNLIEGSLLVRQMQDESFKVASLMSGVFDIVEESGVFLLKKHSDLEKIEGGCTMIFEDSQDRFMLHREMNELLIFKKEKNGFSELDNIPFSEMINGMLEDSQRNTTWMATDIGLFQLRGNTADSFYLQKDTICPVESVKGILIDSLGSLWMSTNDGIINYTPHIYPDSVKWREFNTSDGLQAKSFNFGAAKKLNDGQLVFGGNNGINIINPYEISTLKIKSNPTIIQLEINNELLPTYLKDEKSNAKNITQLKHLVLNYDQNDLRIRIAPLEYSDPSNVKYFFQLIKGKDTITRNTDNTFDYPNMLPGNYTLTYNTSNSDGVWFDDRERKLEITILSPWWKRWWAYLLYILIASGILYYYYRFRIAQIKKKEAFKRKEAEFLQKEAEYKQLVAETETAILRLQMNPHFIFNSMNSISSYILQKDIETANNYLLRFAKLMRMILNFAEKPLIAVSEEMELLEQYLKTETMRFEKKFKYSFEVAEEFDPDEFLIPTMILQPFVENAIWHGMANKLEGEGKILIKFWIENDSLNCSVQDNGIGRSAANKKLRSNDHKSKAISITHRRLEMIQPKDGIHASLEIKDLKDESKKPSGTLVLFRFPIF